MSDNYFDKELQDQLEGYRADYNPADWAAMEQMLNRKKWYMLPWVRTVAVAALITGAAFTTWVVVDRSATQEESIITEHASNESGSEFADPSGQDFNQDPTDRAQSREQGGPENGVTNQGTVTQPIQNNDQQIDSRSNQAVLSEIDPQGRLSEHSASQNPVMQSSGNQTAQNERNNDGIGVQTNRINGAANQDQQDPKIDYPTRPSWADMPEGYVTRKVKYMEPLEPLTIDWLGPKPRVVGGGTDALREYRQHPLRWWIGAKGIPAINIVSNAKPGFYVGGRVGVDLNSKLSLETGVGYTQFAYDEAVKTGASKITLAQDAYLHRSTQGDLRYLEIPLRINYTLGNPGRLEPYVAAGASAFITLNENYVFRYEPNPTYNAQPGTMSEDKSDTLQLENFGGLTSANTVSLDATAGSQFTTTRKPSTTDENVRLEKFYLMGQLAAGVDYLVAPGTTVNVGVNYRFPVSSFGVENRTLHTVGVELGVKYLL